MRRIAVLLFFIASCIYLFKSLTISYYPDFSVHYYGLKVVLERKNPYVKGEGFFIPDVYPPFTQLFFIPFTVFSYSFAEKIWVLISIVSYLVSVYLLFKISKIKIESNLALFLIALTNFFYFPLKFTLGMGQINNFILLLFIFSIYYIEKNREKVGAIFLSLSLLLKFFSFFFVIYLLIKKKRRVVLYTTTLLFALSLLSFIIVGQNTSVYFLTKVLPGLIGGFKTDYYNQSLSGFVSRLILNVEFRTLATFVLSLIIFLTSVYSWIKSRDNLLSISLVVCVSLIINNFSWQHHFVLLLVSFVFVLARISKLKNRRNIFYLLLGVSYYLVGLNLKNPEFFHVLFQSHVLYGTLILFGLNVYLILKREARGG